jgi:hypothetical protein
MSAKLPKLEFLELFLENMPRRVVGGRFPINFNRAIFTASAARVYVAMCRLFPFLFHLSNIQS